MIQAYVPVRDRRRISLPAVVCKALDLDDGQWLRVSVLDNGSAFFERVPPEVPSSHLIHGAAAHRTQAPDGGIASAPRHLDDDEARYTTPVESRDATIPRPDTLKS